jgi:hypothetical protein
MRKVPGWSLSGRSARQGLTNAGIILQPDRDVSEAALWSMADNTSYVHHDV